MAKTPTRVAISIAFSGETGDTETAKAIFGALDRHGLTPQFIENMAAPVPVKTIDDFTSLWVVLGEARGASRQPRFGPDWSRRNAPQGWATMFHRMVAINGRIKLGRVHLNFAHSPRVDWKAAFVDLCAVIDPLVATLDVYRRETEGTLGFVEAFPLPAQAKRERITKPVQVDATPWGILRGVPWGIWLGPWWDDDIKTALADHMNADGPLLCLTDTVPADPDTIEPAKARLRDALPDIFVANPKFAGLP